MAPSSRVTMSPGTSELASTLTRLPSRSTTAFVAVKLSSAASELCALSSCTTPTTTLQMTTRSSAPASTNSRSPSSRIATAMRRRMMKSLSWSMTMARTDFGGGLGSSLGPWIASSSAACAEVSPRSMDVLNSFSRSAILRL
eukprot:Amastigsp_a683_8.p5 type:complete len:142 gc:universal Amastigsp_a683_8:806-381(-)